MRRRTAVIATAAAAALSVSCTPADIGGIVEMGASLFGFADEEFAKGGKIEATVNLPVDVQIGGLSGAYTVDLGVHGSFTGTATIVGQKKAKLVIKDTPELIATSSSLCGASFGTALPVESATMKFNGSQTTGGVKKKFKVSITAKGTIPDGDRAGKPFTLKFRSKGDLEDLPSEE